MSDTLQHDFPDTTHSAIVIGAGIAGLAVAVGLHKVGIPVLVLERNAELLSPGNAIGMWPNAFRALEALGCGDKAFRETFLLIEQAEFLGKDKSVYGKISYPGELGPGQASETRCIRRTSLLERLARELPSGTVRYKCGVDSLTLTDTGATLRLQSGHNLPAKMVLGAEGANSKTTKFLSLSPPRYCGYAGIRGLAPVSAGLESGALVPGTIRLVTGLGVRSGLMQLSPKELYFFVAHTAPESQTAHDAEAIKAEALGAIKDWDFPMQAVIQAAPLEYLQRNRIYDRCLPPGRPFGQGCVTVLGDAAHVSSPNLAQGGCAALEDAVELTRIVRLAVGGTVGHSGPPFKDASSDTIASALREYETKRSKRTSYLVNKAAWIGFIGQSTFWPIVWLRHYFMTHFMASKGFLSHVLYDCGSL